MWMHWCGLSGHNKPEYWEKNSEIFLQIVQNFLILHVDVVCIFFCITDLQTSVDCSFLGSVENDNRLEEYKISKVPEKGLCALNSEGELVEQGKNPSYKCTFVSFNFTSSYVTLLTHSQAGAHYTN